MDNRTAKKTDKFTEITNHCCGLYVTIKKLDKDFEPVSIWSSCCFGLYTLFTTTETQTQQAFNNQKLPPEVISAVTAAVTTAAAPVVPAPVMTITVTADQPAPASSLPVNRPTTAIMTNVSSHNNRVIMWNKLIGDKDKKINNTAELATATTLDNTIG